MPLSHEKAQEVDTLSDLIFVKIWRQENQATAWGDATLLRSCGSHGGQRTARADGFNIPSFAQVLLDWVEYQDQHVVAAALLFYGFFMIVGNLIADVLLAIVDPRIRYD